MRPSSCCLQVQSYCMPPPDSGCRKSPWRAQSKKPAARPQVYAFLADHYSRPFARVLFWAGAGPTMLISIITVGNWLAIIRHEGHFNGSYQVRRGLTEHRAGTSLGAAAAVMATLCLALLRGAVLWCGAVVWYALLASQPPHSKLCDTAIDPSVAAAAEGSTCCPPCLTPAAPRGAPRLCLCADVAHRELHRRGGGAHHRPTLPGRVLHVVWLRHHHVHSPLSLQLPKKREPCSCFCCCCCCCCCCYGPNMRVLSTRQGPGPLGPTLIPAHPACQRSAVAGMEEHPQLFAPGHSKQSVQLQAVGTP
jgi:hypothetical protein